jgi:hypothetical protein
MSLRLADTEAWPQVGDMITLDLASAPVIPGGVLTGNFRTGKVAWTVVAGSVDVVEVGGVEQ